MTVEAQVTVGGTPESVWSVITDFENAREFITGIERIEIVERPADGLVGLRWRETRMLFGKPETVEKWITAAAVNEYYETEAESDGFVFRTSMRVAPSGGGATLASSHSTEARTLAARVKGLPMFLFKGVIRKALLQDLDDVKRAVEQKRSVPA
jgi:uncharacterized protein YndB with AHSA1/START domain